MKPTINNETAGPGGDRPAGPPAWNRLAAAARKARAEAGADRDEAAPFGFSTRVVALWRQAREEERRLALWQRVSWRAAFASLALCAVVAVAGRQEVAQDRPLLEPPSISFPGL
jgi:anti-sigma-K factor RskA